MAQLQVEFPDDLFKQLGKMEDIEKHAPKMIDEALPILEDALRSSYSGYGIAKKLKIVRAKKGKNGGYIGIITMAGKTNTYYVKGKTRYPLSNAGLAVFLEYGTRAHGKFPARPPGGYIAKAVAASHDQVAAKMQEVFERETGVTE